jgi:hypothetical protein
MQGTAVVRLELDDREASLLCEVCRESLAELRTEIVRTESANFRGALKEREHVLRVLLSRLEASPERGRTRAGSA